MWESKGSAITRKYNSNGNLVQSWVAGDMNCDGVVDLGDINLFQNALINGQAWWEANYPNCPYLNADLNGDGNVDFGDINPFSAMQAAGGNAAVAVEVGEGRVFAFCDEWVIYTAQWRDGDTTPGEDAAEYNVCYDMENEIFLNAENYFQIPQFWYNVIKWVAPPNDCFIINDPVIVV